jgi:hypothetical protein
MKPKLKPPGTKRFYLKCDILLSTAAFKINLRRYNKDGVQDPREFKWLAQLRYFWAGPYTRSLLSST